MKKILTLILILTFATAPLIASALSVPLNRPIRGAEQLLYPTDSLLVGASATTTTSKLETPSLTVATSTAGCGQFSATGILYSTGTNCGSGSGTDTNWKVLNGFLTPTTTIPIAITSTGTSTFAGPVSIKGYPVASTTCVSYVGEDCPFQVAAGSVTANTVFQAANDSLSAMGGGKLIIKRGTYTAAPGVSVNVSSNIEIEGQGSATKIIRTATSTPLFKFDSVYNSSIEKVWLVDSTNLYPLGINGEGIVRIQDSQNILIDHTIINSNSFAIFTGNTVTGSSTSVRITNNTLTSSGHQDVIGGGPFSTGSLTTQDIVVDHNNIYVIAPSGGTLNGTVDANCFDMVQTLRIVITNNVCHGRIVLGSEKFPNSYTNVQNNIVDATDGAGLYSGSIVVDQSTATTGLSPTNLTITGNTLRNGNISVTGSSAANVKHPIITANNITGSPSAYSSDNTNGITLTYVTDGIVNTNNITASTTSLTGIVASNTTNTDFSHNFLTGYSTGLNLGSGSGNTAEFNEFDNVTTPYTNTNGYIYMTAAGSIGINTTIPGGNLGVSGATNPGIWLANSSTNKLSISIPTGANNFISGSAINDVTIRQEGGQKLLFSTSASGASNDLTLGNGTAGLGTSTQAVQWQTTIASSTAPQLSLSAGTGVLQWLFNNNAGAMQLATSTIAGTTKTSTNALSIDGTTAKATFYGLVQGIGGPGLGRAFQVGDDAFISDINVANSIQVEGNSDSTKGNIRYGSSGPVLSGSSGSLALTGGTLFSTVANGNAFTTLSGASGSYAAQSFGRTGTEAYMVIPASAGQFSNQAAAGDMLFRVDSSTNKIILQTGTGDGVLFVTNLNTGIGTSSPYAKLSVQSGASTGDAFAVATSSGAAVFGVDNDGHKFTSGPAPVISACGTGTGTVVGDDQSGTITTATAATACTMTFSKAYRKTPTCTVTDNSLVGFADVASISTSAATFGISSALTGGLLFYNCQYHQ